MSWQDDQEAAFGFADDLHIRYYELQNWHDITDWTWDDIADRLAIQAEYASYYERDEAPPQWLEDAFHEYDGEDVPDWFGYYHES